MKPFFLALLLIRIEEQKPSLILILNQTIILNEIPYAEIIDEIFSWFLIIMLIGTLFLAGKSVYVQKGIKII